MKRIFSNMRLKYKLLLPNVLFLLVLGVVVFLSINTHKVIQSASEKENNMTYLSKNFRNAMMDAKDYLNGQMTFEDLFAVNGEFIGSLAETEYGDRETEINRLLTENEALVVKNNQLKEEIRQLADVATQQSNGYVEQTVSRLADETTRQEVTYLERMVILGAHNNTASNLKLLIYLEQLNVSNADFEEVSATLQKFCDQMAAQVDEDIERLAGTPFADLPVQAKVAITKTGTNIQAIVQNVEAQRNIQDAIVSLMLACIDDIDTSGNDISAAIFQDIKAHLMLLTWILGVAIVVAVGLSLVISEKISRVLKRAIDGLNSAAEQVASASTEVSSASQELASGTSEQAASIEETSSSLEEMSAMTKQNAYNANEAKAMMAEARQIVEKVGGHMGDMAKAMEDISQTSNETGKIIKTIDEIAFQTNLLALNAAVEAARAGEAGAGFAVVADEVRNLAMRAAEAAKNTSGLIESTVSAVNNGSELTRLTIDAFQMDNENSSKVGQLVNEIALGSGEQVSGIEQINQAIAEVNKVIQQNAGNSEESAAAAEEMNAQAEQMKQFVRTLKDLVDGGGNDKGRHYATTGYRTTKRQHLTPISTRPETAASGRMVSPNQLIPLEEGDF